MKVDKDARLLRELIYRFFMEERDQLAKLDLGQNSRIIEMMYRVGPITQSELGQILNFEKSWISRMVDQLVAEGWVERTPNPQDRRSKILILTEAGQAHAREIGVMFDAHSRQVLDRLDEAGLANVLRAMTHLSQALPSRYGKL
ncbi:MarR family transcriptional regulator [Jeongeupia sp. HS-3]|uniref:MarR family winged helix-turn-helix transcriptional regulator n=1 Tax=Jeongeupia sp. HS-3 TaxID=1009682 RepID=UPI0018A4BA1A|nr:MarR family transcriptional regulator [Jeongeupia sp. HS-3]BCL74874.1 MarR family transcriptional regulator [Jeongeupia sp. HS-3]